MKNLLSIILFTNLMTGGISAYAQDMSGWSDKTICRLVNEQSANQDYFTEASQRGLDCIHSGTDVAVVVDTESHSTDTYLINDRAPQVNYNKTWNFDYDSYTHTDFVQYRRKAKRWYGKYDHAIRSVKMHEKFFRNNNCAEKLKTDINKWQGYQKPHEGADDPVDTVLCGTSLNALARIEFEHVGRGKWNKLFFDELIPYWLENDAFIMKNLRMWHGHQAEVPYDNMRYGIFYHYYVLGPWWGVSKERDTQMLRWWEMQERSTTASVWAKNASTCWKANKRVDQSDIYPANKPGIGNGLCTNAASTYAWMLTLTGLYHKQSDYINEAIWVVDNIVSGALPDGATVDALRGGQASSYSMKTSDFLDRIAVEMDRRFNYNLYKRANKEGTTVRTVIDYGIAIWLDPESNYKYARKWREHINRPYNDIQGQEARREDLSFSHNREWLDAQISTMLSQIIGDKTWNSPEYRRYANKDEIESWLGLRRPIMKEIMLENAN